MRQVQDHYFKQAKQDGYVSRAAYKLIEIDDRKRVLRSGDRVLDCGCAPGSWLQVAVQRIGPRGAVVGIDLQPVKRSFGPNVRTIEGDFSTITTMEWPGAGEAKSTDRRFDVILSDMAPGTTGDPDGDHHRSVRLCETLLDRAPKLLRTGGNLVMKVFEGQAYPELLRRTQHMFATARGFKPKASRSESAEMYVIAHGFRSPDTVAPDAQTSREADSAPAGRTRPARSVGWVDR